MSTIVTRAEKGSPLSFDEVDNNFTNLNNDKYQNGNALGTPSFTLDCSFAVTGVSATATTNGVTVAADGIVQVTGVTATTAVGSVSVSTQNFIIPTGVIAYATVNSVNVWSAVVDTQDANWQTINDAQTPGWAAIGTAQTPNWQQLAA